MNGCLGWIVLAGVIAGAMFIIPAESLLTPAQREGHERYARLETKLQAMTAQQAAEEIGRARGYEHFCDARLSPIMLRVAFEMLEFTDADLFEGGVYRHQWEYGVSRIAELYISSGNNSTKHELICLIGKTAYGEYGEILPGLLEFR